MKKNKEEGKYQELKQSSTTPYQVTITKKQLHTGQPRRQPCPSR